MNALPVMLIGSGGHALVLLDALLLTGATVIGLTDADPGRRGATVLGHAVLGGDDVLERYAPGSVALVNAVGSTGSTARRRHVYERLRGAGYGFARVIHPQAVIARSASLESGVQVMAGAVIQAGARIGENCIVNTGATVDHGCRVGAHVHVAPGVTLSGDVVLGDCTHVGAGATVKQRVRIGRDCIVGAGAVVLNDLSDGVTAVGIPAKATS